MKSIKYIFLSLTIILIGYVFFKYREFEYYKEVTSSIEIGFIQDAVIGYIYNFYDQDLDKEKNLNRMMKWAEKKHGLKDVKILENGFNVKFDKSSNSYIFYSFGPDKNDNDIKDIPFNFIDDNDYYHLINIRFVEYLFKRNYDIVLFNYKKKNCIKENTLLKNEYILYRGVKSVGFDELINFREKIFLFQKNHIHYKENTFDTLKDSVLYYKFDNNKVYNICNDNISERYVYSIKVDLQKYLDSIDTSYIDYAVFPIIINNPGSR